MDMVLHVELKQYLIFYNKKTLTFLQLAFSLITGHGLQIREIGCTKFETLIKLELIKGFPK